MSVNEGDAVFNQAGGWRTSHTRPTEWQLDPITSRLSAGGDVRTAAHTHAPPKCHRAASTESKAYYPQLPGAGDGNQPLASAGRVPEQVRLETTGNKRMQVEPCWVV